MPGLCRVIYGLVASQVGDFHQNLVLGTGGTDTPASYIYTQYGYRHDYLGVLLKFPPFLRIGISKEA